MRAVFAVQNGAAVAAAMATFGDAVQAKLNQGMRNLGAQAQETAAAACPVAPRATVVRGHVHKPGFLRENIRVIPHEADIGFDLGWVASDFVEADEPFYAPHVTLGTRHQRAQDCLTPAFTQARDRLEALVAEAVSGAVRRAA